MSIYADQNRDAYFDTLGVQIELVLLMIFVSEKSMNVLSLVYTISFTKLIKTETCDIHKFYIIIHKLIDKITLM